LLQIISPEGEVMSKIEYLQQQAARAERLAKDVLDKLTVERLQSFAAECRKQAKALEENRTEAA
jgi:predicted nucleic acid-binding protein